MKTPFSEGPVQPAPKVTPEVVERLRHEGVDLALAFKLAPIVHELATLEARRLLAVAAGAPLPVPTEPESRLSPMEQRAVLTVTCGASQKEAADQLGISVNTLGTHLKRAYAKLGVHSREEAKDALRGVT